MRTRKSNKEKRFTEQAFLAELGSSDEEDLQRAAQKAGDDDSDDGFVVDGAEPEADEDDKFEDVGLSAASEPESEHLTDGLATPAKKSQRKTAGARRKKGEEREGRQSAGTVQQYPTDPSTKWTRSYVGPVSRHIHLGQLCNYWYGDREGYRKIINFFVSSWTPYEIFPPKVVRKRERALCKTPWMPPTFWDDQHKKLVDWYFNYLSTRQKISRSQILDRESAEGRFLPKVQTELTAFLGPHNCQEKHQTKQGEIIPLSGQGSPINGDDAPSSIGGWVLDVGGIALSVDWAPRSGEVDQLLAMTVIPFSDQAFYRTPEEAPSEDSKQQGGVQLWTIPVQKDEQNTMAFARTQPYQVAALCADGWGRIVRMQWCPVPLTVGNLVGLLAILSRDGKVRVIEVKQSWNERNKEAFEEIHEPLATLELKNEYKTEITSFTWVNMNRIAVGHSDGSVALWSLYPCVMLQRHPVHSSPIVDIKSGYPSHPFVVASVPTGGVVMVTDLNRPNAEVVYVANLIVTFQPNVLAWCEHMRGFISLWPSSSPSNIALSFMSIRTWPQSRFAVAISGQPTCIAVGACHPYLLVGSSDGSLWLSNPFRRVFYFKKNNRKLRVLQHDYQASPTPAENDRNPGTEVPRGVCRILHDFKAQENAHPRADRSGVQMRIRHDAQKKKEQDKRKLKKPKGKAKQEVPAEEAADEELESDLDGAFERTGTGDVVNCDPLTRISAVSWNPNIEFSWWAAAAMGSGLVRIMDLGERQVQRKNSMDEEPSEDASDGPDAEEDDIDEDVAEDVLGGEDEMDDEASDVSMEDYP